PVSDVVPSVVVAPFLFRSSSVIAPSLCWCLAVVNMSNVAAMSSSAVVASTATTSSSAAVLAKSNFHPTLVVTNIQNSIRLSSPTSKIAFPHGHCNTQTRYLK
ncbi:hypothetical protein A2U01_0033964, partial [Trifolium medium]|nr:hypothetical protein [Trifolium medium]